MLRLTHRLRLIGFVALTALALFAGRYGAATLPGVVVQPGAVGEGVAREAGEGEPEAAQLLQNAPLTFIANRGQSDPRVDFLIQGRFVTMYFTEGGVTLSQVVEQETAGGNLHDEEPGQGAERGRYTLKLDFVGATRGTRPVGEAPTRAMVSYFKGDSSRWQTAVPTFSRIRYRDLWPGIDLVYSGQANALKYEFIVQPGVDPAQIQLAYRGADGLQVLADGSLQIDTPAGTYRDGAPIAYQVRDGRRETVEMAYRLMPPAASEGEERRQYGFALGDYDPTLPLILDPEILIYAGYIGGEDNGLESGNAIAVDEQGNAYITGATSADETTFPVAVGPDLTHNGSTDNLDAFVVKVDALGGEIVYAGYIGGADYDYGTGIAVDSAGNAYISGYTRSDQSSFPVKVGPDLTHNGGSDAFVAKVNASGTDLVYAGYIGGEERDEGNDITVDSGGNAYVTGLTYSDEDTFPVIVGPGLTFNRHFQLDYADAFVAKVSASGNSLAYAGYIGGTGSDIGYGIAVDGAGSAYITGSTASTVANSFPVQGGPDLTHNGGIDAFVAKVEPSGAGLLYAGYLGGVGLDVGSDIAVDGDGNAHIAGYTRSDEGTFPVIVGPDLTFSGSHELDNSPFVAKVAAAGSTLIYAGYIDALHRLPIASSIALDSSGNAYVVGFTGDASVFPAVGGPDITPNGADDAFIAKVTQSGSHLVYAGYIGGERNDSANGVAVDAAGNAYIVGVTRSNEETFPVLAGPDARHDGYTDVFVAKVGASGAGPVDLAIARVDVFQPIVMSNPFSVLVADKPTTVRVFVRLEGAATLPGVSGRLVRYVGGSAEDVIEAGPITAPYHVRFEEGEWEATLNFELPAHWLKPDTEYVFHLDPQNTVVETNENNNRYPASGTASLSFQETPGLDVLLVPITYARADAEVTNPDLSDLSHYTWMAEQVYPVPQVRFTVRETPFTFTGDLRTQSGWRQLLSALTTLHAAEDPDQEKVYFGLVDFYTVDGCVSNGSGCIAGMAWINRPDDGLPELKTGLGYTGFYHSQYVDLPGVVLAHEVGHIYGRFHVHQHPDYPYEPDPDSFFSGYSIGQWGHDRGSGDLLSPFKHRDYMHYQLAGAEWWTSDYTFYGLYEALPWMEGWLPELDNQLYLPALVVSGLALDGVEGDGQKRVEISGSITAEGEVLLAPIFYDVSGRAPTQNAAGAYRLVWLDAGGRELGSQPFGVTPVIADGLDGSETLYGFHKVVPLPEGVAGVQIYEGGRLLHERTVQGPAPAPPHMAPRVERGSDWVLAWSAQEAVEGWSYRVYFSPDGGQRWQLTAAPGLAQEIRLPARLVAQAEAPMVLVQASDGVRTRERIYDIGGLGP